MLFLPTWTRVSAERDTCWAVPGTACRCSCVLNFRCQLGVLADTAGQKECITIDLLSMALLTTFITPFGRYYFHHLPFGITSAPEHFQRQMSYILTSLEGVVGMIDDVFVHGQTTKEHDEQLDEVLQKLQEAELTVNCQKCQISGEIPGPNCWQRWWDDFRGSWWRPFPAARKWNTWALLRKSCQLPKSNWSKSSDVRRKMRSADKLYSIVNLNGPPDDLWLKWWNTTTLWWVRSWFQDGMLMRGNRVLIPSALRLEMLDWVHTGPDTYWTIRGSPSVLSEKSNHSGSQVSPDNLRS